MEFGIAEQHVFRQAHVQMNQPILFNSLYLMGKDGCPNFIFLFIDLNSSPVKISLVPSLASFQLTAIVLVNSVNSSIFPRWTTLLSIHLSGDETAGDELVLARLEAGDPNFFDHCNGEKIGCFLTWQQNWEMYHQQLISGYGHVSKWGMFPFMAISIPGGLSYSTNWDRA